MSSNLTEEDSTQADDPAAALRSKLLRATVRGLLEGHLPPDEARVRLAIGHQLEIVDALVAECTAGLQGSCNPPLGNLKHRAALSSELAAMPDRRRTAKTKFRFGPPSAEERAAFLRSAEFVRLEDALPVLAMTAEQAQAHAAAGSLICFTLEPGELYVPAFWVDKSNDRTSLELVCRTLGSLPPGVKYHFFVTGRGTLQDLTPLQALRAGRIEDVLQMARAEASD